MRRRDFLSALGGAAAWPCVARAEGKKRRIGFLLPDAPAAGAAFYEAFRAGLRELGYIEGETVEIEGRFGYGDEDFLTGLAKQLVARDVEMIVTGGPGIMAARRATATLPIVVAVGGDLVAAGLAESLRHPGANVTGSSYIAEKLQSKRIAFLKQVNPAMRTVGFLVTRGFSGIPRYLREFASAEATLGVKPQLIEVSDPGDCASALANASIDGLLVLDLPQFTTGSGPAIVADAATRRNLPSCGGLYFARNGGLIGYGADFAVMFRRAAVFVDQILKGAKPGDIPIEQATRFTTVVNLKTAHALKLEIPPDVLAAADEVIE